MDMVSPMFLSDSVCCQLFFKNSEKILESVVESFHDDAKSW